jgi:hypothetical protein
MKHVILLLAFLFSGAVSIQAQTLISDSTKLSKEQVLTELFQDNIRLSTEDIQILIDIRPEVNYVTHLYTLTCRRSVGYSTVCRKRVSAIPQNSIARELWNI